MIERLSMKPVDEWTMEDYILGLKGKDWSYMMADDGDSWRRGRAEDDKLRKVRERLDPEGVIWDKYDWMKDVKL
jgi:hypothetical protein